MENICCGQESFKKYIDGSGQLTTALLHYFKDTCIILGFGLYSSSTKLFCQGHDPLLVGIVLKTDFVAEEFNFPCMPNNIYMLSGKLKVLEYLESQT